MNRHFLSACCFIAWAAVHAQIPNPGFEEWYTINGYDDPVGYISWNALTTQYDAVVCTQASPGHSGASCIQLTTQFVEGMGTNVPAIATTGDIIPNIEGFPCTERPSQLLGWWKYTSGGFPDQAMVLVSFTKWNNVTQQRDDIGSGLLLTEGVADWSPFAVPIAYGSPEDPDTATIVLTASGSGIPLPGSTLWVDDLGFDTGTGMAAPSLASQVVVIDGILHLREAQGGHVRVLDALGRELRSATVNATPFTLELSGIPAGALVVEWVDGVGARTVLRTMR